MAAEGEENSALEFVQDVTPFPMAQDLLLLSKESVVESAIVSVIRDVQEDATAKAVQPLEPLVPEQPSAPFSDAGECLALVENGVGEGQIEFANGEARSVPGDRDAVGVSNDTGTQGDVSEKKVGEKIALFEGLAFGKGDEIDEPLSKRENVGNGDEGKNGVSTMFEGLTVSEPSELALESETIDMQTVEDDREPEGSGEFANGDALFEGLTLIEPPTAAPETEGVLDNEPINLETDQVIVTESEAVLLTETGEEEGEVERLTANESFKEGELQGSQAIILANGTHKVETLGEILTRDRKEKESREGVKGAGEETSSRASSNHNAQSVPEHMGSTPKRSQENNDAAPPRMLRPPVANADGNEVVSHRSSTSGTNIVGDILYNIAVGDEEGRSRQRILAFAAKRYAASVERNPEDHDALYNWALVLQESADNAGPEMGPPGKDALLEEACRKYEAATQLCPTLHEAYYNWAIAISDRAKIRGRTKEAEDLWKQACDRYDRAVQLNWNSPQALNNWGLALQELGAIVALKEKRAIVKKAIRKFRAAIQLRFDFHRAVYNLGTVLYALAEDISRSGRRLNSKEPTSAELNSLSAIYITAAHALKPDYPVYRGALRLVRIFLPLPYIRAGWLRIPPAGDSLAPHSDWVRLWFVLDHEALYEIEKVDRKSLAHSYSRRSSTGNAESSTAGSSARPSVLRIEMEDIICLAPSADLSLPPGGGFCIDTDSGPQYLIADTWEGMDAWVDAIRLVYTIYAQGKRDALAGVLVG